MGGGFRDELIMANILSSYKDKKITLEVLNRVADPYKLHESGSYFTDDTSTDNKNKKAFKKIKEKWEAYKETLVERKSWLFGTTYSKELENNYDYNEMALGNFKTRMISWLMQGAPETESPKMAETYQPV